MQRIKNFQAANTILARFVPNTRTTHGYTLDRMRGLMDFLGNPQNDLKVIHVAGTSGKTSTAYYAAALLGAAGQKVGLTVSPHVSEVNERVQIGHVPLAETQFCDELAAFLDLIEQSNIEPSYFELLVAFAYWEFARQHVDYAVIEVGLGGLLDGTNVVERDDKVCLITDIGLDHINILGTTLPEIAVQKAGIIQPYNVVFCHAQASEILHVFRRRARSQHAVLHVLKPIASDAAPGFLPLFQQRNFSLARAGIEYVLQRDRLAPLSDTSLGRAAQIRIPARMEIFKHDKKTIILDGAHNAQKLHALSQSVAVQFPGQSIAALVSFADGRSFRLASSLDELADLADSLIITAFRGSQDLPHGPVPPEKLAALAKRHNFATIESIGNPAHAFAELLKQPQPLLLVTGSFFLMDNVRPLLATL